MVTSVRNMTVQEIHFEDFLIRPLTYEKRRLLLQEVRWYKEYISRILKKYAICRYKKYILKRKVSYFCEEYAGTSNIFSTLMTLIFELGIFITWIV